MAAWGKALRFWDMLALLPMEFDGKHVTELQHDMYMHVNTVRKQIWAITAESFSFKKPLDPVASGAFGRHITAILLRCLRLFEGSV